MSHEPYLELNGQTPIRELLSSQRNGKICMNYNEFFTVATIEDNFALLRYQSRHEG